MTGSILIVARNNIHLTKQAVRTALDQNVPCDVMVIDNCSTDGTRQWLRTKPQLCVIYPREQLSLSACWNKGLRTFWRIGRTEVLCLNNDVEIRPDTYQLLAAHGGLFVTCVSVDSRERMGGVNDRDLDQLRKTERPHPDMSCFLIRREVTDRIGWFDEGFYPAYCEDLDIHIRMHKAGIKAVCLDLPFLHHAASTIKTADPGEQERIKRGADHCREYFYSKWHVKVGSPEYYAIFESGKV